jgi:hypothetical protein
MMLMRCYHGILSVARCRYPDAYQILANSRLKMLKAIEKLSAHHSVEICYCNIDSIHVSILKSELSNFLEENENIIGKKIGELKIEAISDTGYWFDVGRYWLISNGEVNIFKNSLINHPANKAPFLKNRKFNAVHKHETYNYVEPRYVNIYNLFRYNKRLDGDHYLRYDFEEVKDFDVALTSINNEIFNSKEKKIDLFNRSATVSVQHKQSSCVQIEANTSC